MFRASLLTKIRNRFYFYLICIFLTARICNHNDIAKIGPETNHIKFKIRGGTPTAGPKTLRKNEGLFLPAYVDDHEERRKRGVNLSYKFFEIIYDRLQISPEQEIDTTTYENTERVSALMLERLAAVLREEATLLREADPNLKNEQMDEMIQAKLLGILVESGLEALGSDEYEYYRRMMTAEQKEAVRIEMQKLFGDINNPENQLRSKAVAEYFKSIDDAYSKAFEEFKQQFIATIHSQDVLMNERDKNNGEKVDRYLTIGTLGLFGVARVGIAAATKVFSNTTSSAIFNCNTTRVSLIGKIEKQFNKCVANIAPRPHAETQEVRRMTR